MVAHFIISEDGKSLFDEANFGVRVGQIDRVRQDCETAKQLLIKHGYPVEAGWLFGILKGGSISLQDCVRKSAEETAKTAKMPAFLAADWKKTALERIPPEALQEADTLCHTAVINADGLPLQDGDITLGEDGEITINADAIRERIRVGCTIPITAQHRKDAADFAKFIRLYRDLWERGLQLDNFIKKYGGNWLAPSKYPSIEIQDTIVDIALMRHVSREQVKQNNREYYYMVGGE